MRKREMEVENVQIFSWNNTKCQSSVETCAMLSVCDRRDKTRLGVFCRGRKVASVIYCNSIANSSSIVICDSRDV